MVMHVPTSNALQCKQPSASAVTDFTPVYFLPILKSISDVVKYPEISVSLIPLHYSSSYMYFGSPVGFLQYTSIYIVMRTMILNLHFYSKTCRKCIGIVSWINFYSLTKLSMWAFLMGSLQKPTSSPTALHNLRKNSQQICCQ